ncbi:uncharacterized protein CTRU02_202876 [Colletotrichum truncatum]|uniref:Uncharacterized protein n=1 Tax=Colletotrichum truncatum TaxID=5467 RepID=A0ACC3ZLJ7_COLTU|nr:uncharacterized protein CTRU02_12969 [Colletotrichum truncatum]KAF6783953.1 hypothetical protein CTRU02_12969 [Colletotrichum truncatum]
MLFSSPILGSKSNCLSIMKFSSLVTIAVGAQVAAAVDCVVSNARPGPKAYFDSGKVLYSPAYKVQSISSNTFSLFYSPPSTGTSSGTLRLQNITTGNRLVICPKSGSAKTCFWLNPDSQCTSRLKYRNVDGFEVFEA